MWNSTPVLDTCLGGTLSTGAYAGTVEAYTSGTSSWAAVPSLVTARGGLAAVTGPDGRIFTFGGYNGAYLGTVEAYGAQTNLSTNSGPSDVTTSISGTNFAANAAVNVSWGTGAVCWARAADRGANLSKGYHRW